MERWAGKVAVITGASAGIGMATAEVFLRKGLIVIGLARRKAAMEARLNCAEGPGKFYAVECDVSSEESINNAFDWIKETVGTVHILINNAGILREGSIADTDLKTMQFMMNVNVIGALHSSQRAIQLMNANGEEAHIVNINSVAGLKTVSIPGKYYNVYSASKFALRSMSETLRHELKATKIRVTNISPGAVKTEIFEMAKMDTSFLEIIPILKSEDIADAIRYVIGTPRHVEISELTIRPINDMCD